MTSTNDVAALLPLREIIQKKERRKKSVEAPRECSKITATNAGKRNS